MKEKTECHNTPFVWRNNYKYQNTRQYLFLATSIIIAIFAIIISLITSIDNDPNLYFLIIIFSPFIFIQPFIKIKINSNQEDNILKHHYYVPNNYAYWTLKFNLVNEHQILLSNFKLILPYYLIFLLSNILFNTSFIIFTTHSYIFTYLLTIWLNLIFILFSSKLTGIYLVNTLQYYSLSDAENFSVFLEKDKLNYLNKYTKLFTSVYIIFPISLILLLIIILSKADPSIYWILSIGNFLILMIAIINFQYIYFNILPSVKKEILEKKLL